MHLPAFFRNHHRVQSVDPGKGHSQLGKGQSHRDDAVQGFCWLGLESFQAALVATWRHWPSETQSLGAELALVLD